jgi:hypothetical protein
MFKDIKENPEWLETSHFIVFNQVSFLIPSSSIQYQITSLSLFSVEKTNRKCYDSVFEMI